jgi:hypothetical protein
MELDMDTQVNMAKHNLLENANQGDLGVIEIKPTLQIKGKLPKVSDFRAR